MIRPIGLLAAVACLVRIAPGAVVQIPIDQSQSSLTVTLCISTSCDNDTSPVAGSFTFDLDNPAAPTQASVLDFTNSLTEQIDLNISFGFFGRFDAIGQGITIKYATPGIPTGPVPVNAGAYNFPAVATASEGTVAYTSTGIVCSLLQSQVPPIPCSANLNLADQGVQNGTLQGTLTVANGIITLVAQVNTTVPLDPANPGTGSFSVVGTVRGSAPVPPPPCPGDANADQQVNAADLSVLLANFGQPANGPSAGDFNADGQCDAADLSVLLGRFGTAC